MDTQAEPPVLGRLTGIARRQRHRAPMEGLATGCISISAGLEGDSRGRKYPRRQITLLAEDDWAAALHVLAADAAPPLLDDPLLLPWTARRANLLVGGVQLPRGAGSRLRIGPVELEITGITTPCARMDEVYPGLRRALATGARGGVTCRVLTGGQVGLGDPVQILLDIPVRRRCLPG